MPGNCLHRELAFGLFEQMSFQQTSQFSCDDIATRQAFLAGSVGPDMGVYPGAVALVSDLAHYVRSGDLCRGLLANARTRIQLAYAWGWLAHCVADQILHPLINRGVGVEFYRDQEREIVFAEDPAAHVRVELGLDAYWLATSPRCGPSTLQQREQIPEPLILELLNKAYAENYQGVDFSEALAKSYRASNRWMWAWFHLARAHARKFAYPGTSARQALLAEFTLIPGQFITAVTPRHAAVRGMFRGVLPSEWLRDECDKRRNVFETEFLRQFSLGTPDIPNCNLDTGYIENPDDPYPLATKARALLMQRVNVARHRKESRKSE